MKMPALVGLQWAGVVSVLALPDHVLTGMRRVWMAWLRSRAGLARQCHGCIVSSHAAAPTRSHIN